MKTAEVYLEGRLVRMISMRVGAYVSGFRVVPGRFHDILCEIEGI